MGGFDHDSATWTGGIRNGRGTGAGLDIVLEQPLIGGINGADRGHVGEARGPGQLAAEAVVTGGGEEAESGGARIGGKRGQAQLMSDSER